MRFEYRIGARYLGARRRERFVSIIALISLAGVALGTLTLTLALAIMSGLEEDLRQRLLSFNPHITVERANNGPGDLADLRQRVGKIPGIVGVAPFISGQVLVASSASDTGNGYVTAGVMRGVLPGNNPVLVDLDRTLVEGSLQSLGTSRIGRASCRERV